MGPEGEDPRIDGIQVQTPDGQWHDLPKVESIRFTHAHGPWVGSPLGIACKTCGALLRDQRGAR